MAETQIEHSIAQALLLLSSSSLKSSKKSSNSKSSTSSCSSTVTTGAGFEASTGAPTPTPTPRSDRLRVLALATRFLREKLKVVKRKRSKKKRSHRRNVSGLWNKLPEFETPVEEFSIVSSAFSGATRRQPMRVAKLVAVSGGCGDVEVVKSKKKAARRRSGGGGSGGGMGYMRRRTEAILKLLTSGGCASEIRIRAVLGDSPDTSKALRMLLRRDEVKRSGAGGQKDPYIYMVAESHSDVDSA